MSRQAFYPRMCVLLLGSSLLLIGISARAVEQKQAAGYVGIANALLEIGFNPDTGVLVRLHNRATDDEYLKEALNDGNPFRVYLDATDLPAPLKDPNWWSGKIDGDMGGKVIEAGQCKLVSSSFSERAGRTVLALVTAHADSGLQFRIEVSLADGDCGADWSLMVGNTGTEPHGIMTAFPHILGLQLGASRETLNFADGLFSYDFVPARLLPLVLRARCRLTIRSGCFLATWRRCSQSLCTSPPYCRANLSFLAYTS